jgi:hypothetical protein
MATSVAEVDAVLAEFDSGRIDRATVRDRLIELCSEAPEGPAGDLMIELAVDLGYYERDPARRADSPGYYGDDQLDRILNEFRRRLSQAAAQEESPD